MEIQWELVFYALLFGISIGPFAVMALTGCLEKHQTICKWGSALGLGSIILAGIIALTHLGEPANVVNVFSNLGSQLGQEMLATGITGLIAAFFAGQMFFGWWPAGRKTVAWFGLIGVTVSILLIGNMYVLPSRPMWNTWLLPLTFLASSVVSGLLAMVVLASFVRQEAAEEDRSTIVKQLGTWTLISLIVYGAIELLYFLISTGQEGEIGRLLAGDLALAFWLGLIVAGITIPIALVARSNRAVAKVSEIRNLMLAAFVFVFASAIVMRVMVFILGTRVNLFSG
ncbi:MAG: polysulfide reductase NrfD [Anaerolineales bacterium]|nr:polysulfide reductase NrfD [Anaerolineales bacterium]